MDYTKLDNVKIENGNKLRFKSVGGKFLIDKKTFLSGKYFLMDMRLLEENSATFQLAFYATEENNPRMNIRFGLLPQITSSLVIDQKWLNGDDLFPPNTPGVLKLVCHGSRILLDEIDYIIFESYPAKKDILLKINEIKTVDSLPVITLQSNPIIDSFGQLNTRDWKNKVYDTEELKNRLDEIINTALVTDVVISKFKGNKNDKITEGTGYFSRIKRNGKWYLVDPEGYAFISLGANGVRPYIDGRIDGIESLLEWIPQIEGNDDDRFIRYLENNNNPWRPEPKVIDFLIINLFKIWGENWLDKWKQLVRSVYIQNGMNTIGNWSDLENLDQLKIPYVTSLKNFPDTEVKIFRDFPDVMSEEYIINAKNCAQTLISRKDDPWLIGYFLRNEPEWAFVNNLVIADEVFYNPIKSRSKEYLINKIINKYKTINVLNNAYDLELNSFDELKNSIKDLSMRTKQANSDMHEFSKELIRRYIEVPIKECRKVDTNHMILGMRWAWIENDDFIEGWELFDAFSINCYAEDPSSNLDNLVTLGIDLPVIIGEFHFGALDVGLPATGLEGVETQLDRGLAYSYYCERVAAHPLGVGCHYFQFYDQFALGRFDGENYNIGLLDICSQPYEEALSIIRECHHNIYNVMDGSKLPTDKLANFIPMVAY
ncbi:hypothetical protein ACTQ54_00290 [Fundicoccus sp. Sow4_H7]|uniref:hypothetical protein n=1 Tax=Fundicoccus sp. Sow4_H7 TaxID=3438784 RepID=UPI003F93339E